MERKVDVAIIGAGSAGLTATSTVRRYTDNFVLIDGGELGTTCARVGCMPSKAAIQVAEDMHRRTALAREGIEGGEGLSVDRPAALEHVRHLRDHFVDQVLATSTDDMDEEQFLAANAYFLEPTLLQVGERQIRAEKIIIATGSRPVVPRGWERFGERILTTDTFFELEDLPARVAVVGLGVIGLELGQTLARLGVQVTGFDLSPFIGGLRDPDVNAAAVDIMGKEFPLWLGAAAELTEEDDGLRVTAGERSVVVDKVLVCMGRRPNLGHLGLDTLGVPFTARGIPEYDPHTMQIGQFPIFLAGDVDGDRPILHEANLEGRMAAYNATHEPVVAFKRKVPLAITFCDPNIVSVGLPFDALQEGAAVIGEMKFAPLGRALVMNKNKGLLRVYARKLDGKLLGAAMIAPKGENLGHLLNWCIHQELGVADLLKMPFYHPTIEEGLQAALYDLRRQLDIRSEIPLELEVR